MEKIREIPKIQQQPKQASDTAIHYGYVAFKNINLQGPLGLEYKVQPPNSPYHLELPCRELIPFTNVAYSEIDELAAASTSYGPRPLPMVSKQKTARQCVDEMTAAYEDWGFMALSELTGFPEDEAFQVFQTIQPFTYKLKDLLDQVEYGATDRINETAPYRVNYEGESFELQPLSSELKEVARKVQQTIIRSAEVAFAKGEDQREKTVQSMTQYFSTGNGKRRADPLDQYLFDEFGQEIPKLLGGDKEKDSSLGVLDKLAEVILGKQQSEDLAEKVAKLEAQLAAKEAPKEPVTIESAPKAVTVGDSVIVGGQQAVVTAKPFGRVKVQFADGSTITVPKDEIG